MSQEAQGPPSPIQQELKTPRIGSSSFFRGPEFGKMSGFAGRTLTTVSCFEAAVHLGLKGPKSGMRDPFKARGHHRHGGSTLA